MIAPVHPKPTSTASTGLRVVVMILGLPPAGAAFEADSRVGNALSVASHPFLVIVMGAREADHLPGTHIFVAPINRIGKITFLGVLQEHRKEGFAVDPIIQGNCAALEPLQQLVLILREECAER